MAIAAGLTAGGRRNGSQPETLDVILKHTAEALTEYVRFQIDSGAQAVQIFDSWGGQLTPVDWEVSRCCYCCAPSAVLCVQPTEEAGVVRASSRTHTRRISASSSQWGRGRCVR